MAELSSPDHVVAPRAAGYEPYDATSDASQGRWDKLPGGPADLSTGELTGEDFPSDGPWRQC
jgi:hypothetical protein